MSIPLDQLKAQRDLVKRHLEWLDARIAEYSGAGSGYGERPAGERHPDEAPAAAHRSPLISPTAPAGRPAATPDRGSTLISPASVTATELPAERILEAHGAMESGLSKNAKLGCIAIAAAVALGFLFVLFVLPHFLYGGKKSATPETAPVERVK